LAEVVRANTVTEFTELMDSHDELIVDFSKSVGCVFCTRLAPHFKKAAEKSDKVFVEVDVLTDPDFISAYALQSVPTVLHFRKGQPTVTLSGRTSVKLLQEIN
jgi:thioredoxin 1